jgi:hypothetical protein
VNEKVATVVLNLVAQYQALSPEDQTMFHEVLAQQHEEWIKKQTKAGPCEGRFFTRGKCTACGVSIRNHPASKPSTKEV